MLQSFSEANIGRDTPINSVEETEVSIDEDSDTISEGAFGCNDGGYGAQYSPTQAKANRIAAGRSARRSTLSPEMLLHVSEASPVSRMSRRAKSQEPVTVTRGNYSQSQNSFRKDQSSGMSLQAFLRTLLSPQEIAIAASLPTVLPEALRGRLWAEVCQGPTQSDGTGNIYVYETTFPPKGVHASPRADPGNVVIKVGRAVDVDKRGKQHAANKKCNLNFALLKVWPDVAYHARIEQIILATLATKRYIRHCGAGCTTDHKEMFEVRESELPFVYEIIEEWAAWGKNL
ncbi:hypothetical protein PISL3812_07024 [Talaromyces islandicus]|uniref:Bacteriophage T5 Orf172 DNA-binding domain-containing protein n=1 Tax=Talaromyces islandicus TaxID=28573 RepID=A0A0U1M390_TALIS|nr:hypothetical protein PISL3812_07024 [Talaromyces islandicus]